VKKRRFRALVALGCLVIVGAAIQDFRFGAAVAGAQSRQAAVEREIGGLSVSLSDLRAAQMAYLAAGQDPDSWMRRATDLSMQIDAAFDRLRQLVPTPTAGTHVEAAAIAVADLMSSDKRARTALQSGQRFVASDVIFVDSLSPVQVAATELAAARSASADATAAVVARQSAFRLALTPIALVVVLFSMYGAGRASRAPESPPATIAEMIRDLPPPVKGPGAPPVKLTVPAPPPVPPVNLTDAAELCVDLARVIDARDMQGLLERTAKVLEASGLILWVVNLDRTSLLPVLTHGYSERVLMKLGALDVEADNVTSFSYRSVRAQTMLGSGPGTTSAIAVPLVTAGGCNGVLAAEVYDSKPSAEFIALSRLIAAQFATMINPCETQTARAAQA
jgi:hypothetical protein